MPTFRTTVIFDFEVPDGTDEDEFHDNLRVWLEDDADWDFVESEHGYNMDSVREISIKELDD